MTAHLYLAPAGQGKTTYVLERIRQARAANPLTPIIVILPNQAQVSAFRHRLSQGRGALGVSLGTFYSLYAEVLIWAERPAPCLPEPAQYRLLRSIVVQLADLGALRHYAPLRDKPGFVVALRALLEELKRARIHRDDFRHAVQTLSDRETRLAELAEIYSAYQDWLLDQGWVDTEGQGWLAASALERQPDLGRHLRLLIVDGFDEFNPTQLAVLKLLVGRAAETAITLTGTSQPRPALRRFTRALQAVSQALNLEPEPVPGQTPSPFVPSLAHLEANLFEPQPQSIPANGAINFLEAQNRAEEVRAALRWLKARLARDNMAPAEVALLARNLTPYRPLIEEVAAEFGLTLHLREGLNLATNPVIAALLSLLSLPVDDAEGAWARRPVLDAWRCPYFEGLAPGVSVHDADRLDAVARQGLVIQGLDQWREALAQLIRQAPGRDEATASLSLADEELSPPERLTRAAALALQNAFEAFVARITPPPQATLREYAAFVEDLIGDDPKLGTRRFASGNATTTPTDTDDGSLGVVRRAWAIPATAQRDIAALRAFKDVLRSLILAESSIRPGRQVQAGQAWGDMGSVSYRHFYQELRGAVQGATYYLPPPASLQVAVPVLSVLNARGLSFRAVALIGLAEGEFPQPEQEDILLRERDRWALRRAGLAALEPRLRGDEISLFYQAVTRARQKLLLSRPYLADDGQTWEPSPYWREVRHLVNAPVEHIRPEDPLSLTEIASPQELARALAQRGLADLERGDYLKPVDTAHLQRSAAVLRARLASDSPDLAGLSMFEGDLTRLTGQLSTAYGPDHVWSSSRLEAYGLCPLHFWLGQDLALEPRLPPDEGFDVFILGSMYHEILEEVYRQAGAQADGEHLLQLLPAIAQQVFDKAPDTYGFRPTPLWEMQRRELEQILARTLVALAETTAGSTPVAQEQVFGMSGHPPLVIQHDGEEFRVRGFIDRVDRDADGRLRIIDYKSGSTPIAARDLVEGRRLQIALYALAARDALALGDIADGFYWHIGSAKASSLKLEKFEGGVSGALETALAHALEHVAGVRAGRFAPSPPDAGCPGHCPGASFCWRYKAKGR